MKGVQAMNLKRRDHKNKYFYDVFILVFILVLGISLSLFLVLEYHQITTLRQEQEKDEHILLENYANKIDRELKGSFEFLELLLLEPLTREFVENDRMDQYNKIQLFQHISDTSPYNNISQAEVIMYTPEKDSFLSKNGVEHLYDMNKRYGNIPYKIDEVKRFEENKLVRLVDGYTNAEESNYIVFFIKKTAFINEDVCFLITLNKEALKESVGEEQIRGFYINENGNNLFEYDENSKNAKNEIIFKNSAVIHEWEYGIITDVFKVPFYFAIRFSLIVILIIFMSAYVSRLIAGKFYKMFENLSKKFFDKNFMYDEINSLKTAFDKMLEKKNELKNNRENYEKILRQDLLKKILIGKAGKNEIDERENLFPIETVNGFCCAVCIISSDEYTDAPELKNALYEEFVKKMNSQISAECIEFNLETSVFLYPWDKRERAETIMLDNLASIEQVANARIRMIIVDYKFNSLSNISGLYGELRSLYENQILFDENIIHHYNYETMRNNKYYYPMEIENKLISFVREGNKEECYALLYHLIDMNVNEKVLSSNELVEFKVALLITAKRIIDIFELSDAEVADEEKIRERLLAGNDEKSLKAVLHGYYDDVFEAISAKKNTKQSLLFNELNKYVIENFNDTEKVSVVSLASRFNVSVGYISKLYRKMTGKTFIDYVLGIRIAKAKNLLLEQKTAKIKEIGESVGYTNVTSFVRYFKKATGLTPNEYRAKHVRDEISKGRDV